MIIDDSSRCPGAWLWARGLVAWLASHKSPYYKPLFQWERWVFTYLEAWFWGAFWAPTGPQLDDWTIPIRCHHKLFLRKAERMGRYGELDIVWPCFPCDVVWCAEAWPTSLKWRPERTRCPSWLGRLGGNHGRFLGQRAMAILCPTWWEKCGGLGGEYFFVLIMMYHWFGTCWLRLAGRGHSGCRILPGGEELLRPYARCQWLPTSRGGAVSEMVLA